MALLEVEGKTVEEAIEIACRELQVSRDKLQIEVLSAGSTGIFGIVGTKKAKIKAFLPEEKTEPALEQESIPRKNLEPREQPDLSLEMETVTAKILELMGLETHLQVKTEGNTVTIVVEGDKSGLLIGRQGETIDALQYILSRVLSRLTPDKIKLVLDSGGYRERRKKYLSTLALRLAEKSKKTGKPVVMSPLNAHDRRIVHLALEKDKTLKTISRGEGAMKKIIISPMSRKAPAAETPVEKE
jgi:spoIIIJ-associated protein